MLDLYLKMLEEAKEDIFNANRFESDDADQEYSVNKKAKMQILNLVERSLIDKQQGRLQDAEYSKLLTLCLSILSANTGCAEDLEILELILDALHDKGIIDSKIYKDVVDGAPVARWL